MLVHERAEVRPPWTAGGAGCNTGGMRVKQGVLIAVAVVASGTIGAAPAYADEVVVDSKAPALEVGADGTSSGLVTMINLGEQPVSVEASVSEDPGCTPSAEPAVLPPLRISKVALGFNSGCDLSRGIDAIVKLRTSSQTESQLRLSFDPPPAEQKPDFSIVWKSGILGLLGGIVVIAWLMVLLKKLNNRRPSALGEYELWLQHQDERMLEAAQVLKMTAPPKEQLDKVRAAALDDARRVRWSTSLSALGTSWSFKDGWISNLALGTTALVGLFAASNVLQVIVGGNPEETLAIVAVASGIAALGVGLSPLVVKLTSDESDRPRVGGVYIGGFIVIVGALTQIAVITAEVLGIISEPWLKVSAAVIGIAVGVVLVAYSIRSLHDFVVTGTELMGTAEASPVMQAAWTIVAALRPSLTRPPLTPFEIEEARQKIVRGWKYDFESDRVVRRPGPYL